MFFAYFALGLCIGMMCGMLLMIAYVHWRVRR